jgi:AcrR family transcriptional regulator
MSDASNTRQRLVSAAEQLFRVQGYSGTGLKQLTAEAEAPWGSLYHFFPGGKAGLGAEATRYAGEIYAEGWRRAFERGETAGEAVDRVFRAEVKILESSNYRNGCPIASTTLDVASVDEGLRLACDAAFGLWIETIARGLEAHGAPPQASRPLAMFIVSTLEGAIVLARAAKDPAPLVESGRFLRDAVDRAAEDWA